MFLHLSVILFTGGVRQTPPARHPSPGQTAPPPPVDHCPTPRGPRDASSISVQFFSFLCSFLGGLAKTRGWPLHFSGWYPPTGKSWIRHCPRAKNLTFARIEPGTSHEVTEPPVLVFASMMTSFTHLRLSLVCHSTSIN